MFKRLLALTLPCWPVLAGVPTLLAYNPEHVAVGAIRWDGFMGPPNVIGRQEEFNLSPERFRDRLPFFATELARSEVRIREITPAEMKEDIAFAVRAGIDYWAFNWYPPGSYFRSGERGPDLSTALNLYRADRSSRKPAWCLLLSTRYAGPDNRDNFDSWILTFIAYFKDRNSRYQTVLHGRPLIYLFGSNITRADLQALRRRCAEASVPNPFIVDMTVAGAGLPGTTGWSHCADDARARGADAVSSYVTAAVGGGPYARLTEQERNGWSSACASGFPVVPWVTFGWDPRPRIENPALKDGYPDHYYPLDGWAQSATPSQCADELQRAIDWCDNHPRACAANAVIIYAWDELTEGSGQLMPTLANGTLMLDAAARVTGKAEAPPPLAPGWASFSSSDAEKQPIVPGPDSAIHWRGSGSLPVAAQWLECDFRSAVAVDELRLAEPGDRISAFAIGYWDGSAWRQVYQTGAMIAAKGRLCAFCFPEVVARRLRLRFLGGGGVPAVDAMIPLGESGAADLALGRRYCASSQAGAAHAPYWAFYGVGRGWMPHPGGDSPQPWIEVDFGAMTAFDQVMVSDAADAVRSFRLEASPDGRDWRRVADGRNRPLGRHAVLDFERVTACRLRLTLVSANGPPLIEGFEVHCRHVP